MKKQITVLAINLIGLSLISACQNGTPSSTASASVAVSSLAASQEAVSSSALSTPEDYLACLVAKPESLAVVYSCSIKKDGISYKDAYERKEMDLDNKIEHISGNYTTLAGYESNDTDEEVSYEIYKTPDAIYTRGYDNKFTKAKAEGNVFAAYKYSFDFSVASSLTGEKGKFTYTLNGKVAQDKMAVFAGSNKLDDVVDFSFTATLSALEGYLTDMGFSYTQGGYNVSIKYQFITSKQFLTVPTIV